MSPLQEEENSILIAQCCVFRSFAVLGVNGDCAGSNDRCRWLMTRVSGHVKSHTKHLPCDYGTRVKLSERFPSFCDRLDGSSLAGI